MKRVIILTALLTLSGWTTWTQNQSSSEPNQADEQTNETAIAGEGASDEVSAGEAAAEDVEAGEAEAEPEATESSDEESSDAGEITIMTPEDSAAEAGIASEEDAASQQDSTAEMEGSAQESVPAEGEMTEAEGEPQADEVLRTEEGDEIMPLIVIDNAPLTDVIKTLARQARINFMFDPRITAGVGRDGQPIVHPDISIRFENVSARQALEAVLRNHDLELVPDEKTGIARITYINPEALPPLLTEVIQLKYAPVTNMVEVLRPTISQRSSLIPDARSSKLVVVATETELEEIHTLLDELDTSPKQVLIEANIMETSKNPKTVKGINWSGTLEAQKFTFGNGVTSGTVKTPGDTVATTTTLPSGRTITSSRTSETTEDLLTQVGKGGLSLDTLRGFHPATAFLNADGVSAVLSFLNTQDDTRVVATPRTVTLDNETARLEVSRAFPILEVTPGSANSPAGSTITYTNLGTILEVTPRISANNNIALKVIPEVSNIDSKDEQVINGQINQANVYAIRKTETRVMIPSGHTLVMGGLINDEVSKAYSKVPVLGDVPLLGGLFRHQSKERKRQNLLIFITPTIVSDDDFQMTPTDFLATKKVEPPPEELLTPWDSARPYNWREQYWTEPIKE